MRYVFYGKHQVTDYDPKAYYVDYYGVNVETLGAITKTSHYEEFYSKDNVHVEIKKGDRININGESVHIGSVEYSIFDDYYNCYTSKLLSVKDGNMTKEQAEKKLNEIKDRSNRGFLKRLFNR